MIMLTKEQLADLLREAFILGYECSGESWNGETDPDPAGRREWVSKRETYIHPLVHRSSGGHDDHGREVNRASGEQAAGKYRDRPNHHVHRGHESLPCHCWADSDHQIGAEVNSRPIDHGREVE